MDEKHEEFDSDSDKHSDYLMRPSTMGGRINYGKTSERMDSIDFRGKDVDSKPHISILELSNH